jgi:hypothetical protein
MHLRHAIRGVLYSAVRLMPVLATNMTVDHDVAAGPDHSGGFVHPARIANK